MAKKQWYLLAVLLLLVGVYLVSFTHWDRHPAIQISHSTYAIPKKSIRLRYRPSLTNSAIMTFNLDHAYQLTEVKVVRLADWQTNKSVLPVWHLTSDSNSVPTKRFYYGAPLRGMKPVVPGNRPKPLETNVTYRLFLTTGSVQGQHDFSPPPPPPPR